MLAKGPTKHRQCGSCHAVHGDPKRGTEAACRSCHREEGAKARQARDDAHRDCKSCHEPHKLSRPQALTRCGTCHEKTVASGGSHRDTCTKCHQQHGRTPEKALACGNCHEKVRRPTVAEHSKCQDCHRPHERARDAHCEQCHETQARSAKAWPADNPHSGACRTCHQPHNEAAQPTCASCHAKQATLDHVGEHRLCKSCHASHRPRPEVATGWWSGCSGCHDEQARGVASAKGSPTHGRCSQCHNNPRWKAPSCESCHREIKAVLLHATKEHQECYRCHTKHGTEPAARRQCLACHEQKQNHYPDAPRCQACHPFSPERSNQ